MTSLKSSSTNSSAAEAASTASPSPSPAAAAEVAEALARLLTWLQSLDYRFTTPTPETHRRVLTRANMAEARDLRGVFGWSLPFAPHLLPDGMAAMLGETGLLEVEGHLLKAKIRVSSIGERLFVHSAFPTEAEDSVFLGPDSYRFVDFLRAELPRAAGVKRVVDIGAGAGVGAIMAAPLLPGARLTLTDINPTALRYAGANARHSGLNVELIEGSGLDAIHGPFDLAIANPPFIIDQDNRTYRDGGDMHGARLSLDWAFEAARRVEPGGRVLLYTGSAIIEGHDALREGLERSLPADATLRYRELDPDIFGEELDKSGYEEVERITAVGAVIETRSP